MTKQVAITTKQYVICLLFALLGCEGSILALFNLFDFGQEQTVTLPVILGILIVIQLMELILERMKTR